MKAKAFLLFLVALFSGGAMLSAANLLVPGQPIIGVAATPGSSASSISTAGGGANQYPAAESPPNAIDSSSATKYLNFSEINCGFILTIPGGNTTVTGFVFTAANDAPERDPAQIVIEGTVAVDPNTAAASATWVQIYSGPSGLAADPGRFANGLTMAFTNTQGFNTYRMLVTDVRNQAGANSMQFSEIQFIGNTSADTNPPIVSTTSPVRGATVGALTSVTVTFSEAVLGVTASDFLVNGTPATGVSGSSATFTFSFAQPPVGAVNISFAPGHGITDFAAPANFLDETSTNAQWTYNLVDNTPPRLSAVSPIVGVAVEELNTIQVNFTEDVTGVDAGDLLINGNPATNLLAVSPSIYTFEFAQPPTGAVSVVFQPGGITDLAAAPNAFAGSNWNYTLDPNLSSIPFLITEFMAANSGDGVNGIRDEDGDSSDWIEIFNPLFAVANVGGYYLTDAAANLSKWRIPAGTTIPSRGYLVVFASGKNRTNILGRLHTNFQLGNSGEYLALVNPKTNVISEYFPTYPSQTTDVSYGRDRNAPSVVGYYATPTPGSNNVTSGLGFGPEVNFSVAGGTFLTNFLLTLSVNDPGSVIRYTIINTAQDVGSATNIPTATSTLYTNPIPVSTTVQIRARAFPTNGAYFPGPPRSENYILVSGGITNFESTLPIVVLHTLSATALSGGYPSLDNSIIVQTFDVGTNGKARLLDKPQLSKRAGVNLRGSSTQGFPKGSFALELWDEFNADEESDFLGLPKESDWVLYAPNQFDTSLMHNRLLHHFPREMGYYSSRTRFVEVFVRNGSGALTGTTNATGSSMGDYVGVYVLEEKVKRDGNRVDIDEVQFQHTNYPAITGGYLMKIDRTDGNERTFSPGGVTVNYQDPDGLEMVTPARATQAAYLNSFMTAFHNSLQGTGLTNNTGTNHYSNYLDIDGTIDLHIMNVLTLNVDGYRLSGYLNKPRNGKLIFGPLWDVDRGLGTTKGDGRPLNPRCWQASNPSGSGGTDNGTDFFQGSTAPSWLGRMFADLDFWQRWIDRYQDWRTSILHSNHINAVIDQFAAELNEAQPRELKRWQGGGSSDTSPRNGTLTTFNGDYSHTFNGTWAGEMAFQKRWIVDRIHFMDTNLLNRPGLGVAPGLVASGTVLNLSDVTGKAGTAIYYTLDGSDPRAPQGLTNPAAILYTGPVTITNNVRVRARAVNASHSNMTGITGVSGAVPNGTRNPVVSSRWSGVVDATYFTAVPPLIVTELMYHPPASGTPGDTNDVDNYEFIELRNVGGTTLNLVGFSFTNGIGYTFTTNSAVTTLPPGGYVVLAANTNSFAQRYGTLAGVAGAFSGNFDNAGERVTLVGPALEPVLDFEYKDGWYDLTDGTGFSLVAVDDSAPSNLSTNTAWRISSQDLGSPGAANPPQVVVTDVVVITEALTHTDLPSVDTIELYNGGTNAADLSGWWLSDDRGTPKKFQIPPGTILPAGSYLTFDENQFNPGGTNGFALASDGDEVWVFSGTNGFITGYYQGYDFGAAQNGRTFGRYVNSQTNVFFVAQAANTLGTNNSLPLVGPVVIDEIMFHPPDLGAPPLVLDNSIDEFIELKNISLTNVPLYHAVFPENAWRLTRAVDFTFPTNVVIAPTSSVLVVGFNPASPADLAAFRTRYNVPTNVPVYGPWSGKLDNSSDTIRLSRPDAPNGRDVPYIMVDQVTYGDASPWPLTADGFGASLQRAVSGDFGNDPTNWFSAGPSAGYPATGGGPPVITQQPESFTVVEGTATNLSVVVSSATPVTYQWRLNSNGVPGGFLPTLNFPAMQLNQAGAYDVAIFNGGGGVVSTTAVVTVLPLPVVLQQPQSTNPAPGSNFTISVQATGNGPLSYQWRYNGANITGATNTSIFYTNAQLFTHAGFYDVLITDSIGTRITQPASVIVMVRPGISNQPVAKSVIAGQNATFSLVAGPIHPMLPLTYRWLTNGVGIATSSVPSFTFTNVQFSRSVRCNVINLAGNVNSSTVQLTVLADSDGDGIPDTYESGYPSILSPVNALDAAQDPDFDAFINLHEYIAGTVPTNGASYLKLEPVLRLPDGQHGLQFTAVSNRTYTVDYNDAPGSGTWSNLFLVPAAGTNRTLSFTNNSSFPTRVYRLSIPPSE